MAMAEALGRIQEIRGALDQLAAAAVQARATAGAGGVGATIGGTTSGVGTGALSAAGPASADATEAGRQFAATLNAVNTAGNTAGSTAGSGGGAILESVQKYLGLPYVWGGNDPAVGLDCSSFVQHVFKDLGYTLPRVTWDQMAAGTEVAGIAQALPGDLLFTHNGGHVSIYLGDGLAVDAPQPGRTIQIRDAWETDGNITTIRRILPAETPESQPISDRVASARMAQAALLGAGG